MSSRTSDGQVVFAADSGPTQAIWDVANGSSKPTTVFMECTFPDSLLWLADIAKHLTPSTFAGEMAKVKMGSRFITVHIHPRQRAAVTAESPGEGSIRRNWSICNGL
jgi:ribonuclease BN (tRNA processing enzyme)